MAIATVLSGIDASSDFVRADPGAGQGIPAVTHTVFLDVGLCDSIVRADRALGNKGGVCTSPETLPWTPGPDTEPMFRIERRS